MPQIGPENALLCQVGLIQQELFEKANAGPLPRQDSY